jgi:hypothetical protein
MHLNVKERLVLLDALPKEGNLTTIKLVRQLRESLSFTEEEHTILQFKVQDGQARWLQEYGEGVPVPEGMTKKEAQNLLEALNEGVEIEIGIQALQVARESLDTLNEAGKLGEQHISLCEKFEITE